MMAAKTSAKRRDLTMPHSIPFVRWCGLAAMLGGTLWVIGNVVHASKPRGCIAEE